MGRTLAILGIVAVLGLLAGCRCCPQDNQLPTTDAACRCGMTCAWPLEGHTVDEGEPQLMPQTNRVVGCPGFTDGYRYTKLPFGCDTRYDK